MQWLNENAPAIQAVGSLVAIAIAIGVPVGIHLGERRTRNSEIKLRGQAIAALIEPELRALNNIVERESIFRREGNPQFEIPALILSKSEDLWLMGEAGQHVLQVVWTLQTHNRILRETRILPIDMEDDVRQKHAHEFHERLNRARRSIAQALDKIEVLLAPSG